MDLKSQKEYIETIKKCQRNWDHSKSVNNEHLEHLIYLATNSPTKQYEAYFNVYVIKNRKLLSKLLDHTWGFTYPVHADVPQSQVPCSLRNPQVDASVYFLYTIKPPETSRNFFRDGTNKPNSWQSRIDNAYTSIGISMGIVAFSAASLGYVTAFNKNHEHPDYPTQWYTELEIPDTEKIAFGLGIGFGKDGYKHNETDEHKMLVGYPDFKIIDINTTNTIKYNNSVYPVRNEIKEYPSFSIQDRQISVKIFE